MRRIVLVLALDDVEHTSSAIPPVPSRSAVPTVAVEYVALKGFLFEKSDALALRARLCCECWCLSLC